MCKSQTASYHRSFIMAAVPRMQDNTQVEKGKEIPIFIIDCMGSLILMLGLVTLCRIANI